MFLPGSRIETQKDSNNIIEKKIVILLDEMDKSLPNRGKKDDVGSSGGYTDEDFESISKS